jgi:hypothetical protein
VCSVVRHVAGRGQLLEPAAAQRVQRLPPHDPAQPGREGLRVEQPRQAAPGDQERLLGHVAGEVGIVQERHGRAVGQPLVALDQRGEGLEVALARALHQRRQVHWGPPVVTVTS